MEFPEVSPQQVLGRFNGFLKSVILRVSEARDLGEFDRFAFYDHMKAIIAAPPDVLRIDEKNRAEYAIPNVSGVIITTNHKTDGIYLPADDRRHFVAWSDLDKSDFTAEYWNGSGTGTTTAAAQVVAHYLHNLDLSAFNPKAPPPQTERSSRSSTPPDRPRMPSSPTPSTLLGQDEHGPRSSRSAKIVDAASQSEFIDYLKDRKNSRKIPHRFEACGYTPVRNPDAEDGLWGINGRRQVVYARSDLSLRDRIAAAQRCR